MTTASDGRWHPGIGDPNATGWITVAAYATAMLLCYACRRRAPPGIQSHFWFGLVLIMGALGVNKQLDLQTWLTEVGRDLALHHGWYTHRRAVQMLFIAAIGVTGSLAAVWFAQRCGELDAYARRASYGLVVLGVFVLVRAASFHHVDELLGATWNSITFNALLELGGIGVIALAAWGGWRTYPANPDNRRH